MSDPLALTAEEVQQKQAALQEEYEQKRLQAREAAQERRRRLTALGPEFVRVIKAGQAFTRFTSEGPEEVFVWFEQPPGRSGVLHWEPVAPEGEAQPRNVAPERSLKFSAISDIFMGRSTDLLAQYVDKAGMRLCLSFVVHMGSDVPSLHLKARKKLQMEAWMYGVQHILKQGGFHFLEANESLDRKEQEIFEKYTAKQIVRMLEKKNPEIANLRLQATLNQMNRGQVFKRYLPDNTSVKTLLFFCSDGGHGTIFWGPRSHPEGFLRLRHVSDVWLGKHDLLKQPCAEAADPTHCVSLVSKNTKLALEAPSSAVMAQWMFGIHSLLTATKEMLEQINSAGGNQFAPSSGPRPEQAPTEIQTAEAAEAAAAAAAEARAAEAEAAEAQAKAKAADETGDAAAAEALRAAAERASARAAQLATAALASSRIQLNLEDDDEFDFAAALAATSVDEQALAAMSEMEAMFEDTAAQLARDREERRKNMAAREEALVLAAQKTRELEQGLNEAGNAAMAAITAARALRERALADKEALEAVMTESHQTVEDVLALAAQALGDPDAEADGLADFAGGLDDVDDDEDDESEGDAGNSRPPSTSASPSESKSPAGDDVSGSGGKSGRGRRLSLFSALDLDEDVKKALTFEGSALALLDDLAADGDAAAADSDQTATDADTANPEEGDEWTTLMFDVGISELAEAATHQNEAEGVDGTDGVEGAEGAEAEHDSGEVIEDEPAAAASNVAAGTNASLSIAIPEEGDADEDHASSAPDSQAPPPSYRIPSGPGSEDEADEPEATASPATAIHASPSAGAGASTPSSRSTAARIPGSSASRLPGTTTTSRISTSRIATPTAGGSRTATTPSAGARTAMGATPSSRGVGTATSTTPRVASHATPVSRVATGRTTTPATGVTATTTPAARSSVARTPASGSTPATSSMLARRGSAGTISTGVTPARTGVSATPGTSQTPRVASLASRSSSTTTPSAAGTSSARPGSATPSSRMGITPSRPVSGLSRTTTPAVGAGASRTTTPATGTSARVGATRTPVSRVAIHLDDTPATARTTSATKR